MDGGLEDYRHDEPRIPAIPVIDGAVGPPLGTGGAGFVNDMKDARAVTGMQRQVRHCAVIGLPDEGVVRVVDADVAGINDGNNVDVRQFRTDGIEITGQFLAPHFLGKTIEAGNQVRRIQEALVKRLGMGIDVYVRPPHAQQDRYDHNQKEMGPLDFFPYRVEGSFLSVSGAPGIS